MVKTTEEKLNKSVEKAKELYNRLVLLVGPASTSKETVLNKLSEKLNCKKINLNFELSKRLLEMANRKRPLKVAVEIDEIIAPFQDYAVLDFTEILFETSLKQDPLALLKRISRNKTIIASWRGNIEANKLTYAETGHKEYRIYDTSGIQIVEMENSI